jgi:hypothetical protein
VSTSNGPNTPDLTNTDARLNFWNSPGFTTGTVTFAAGQWSDEDIEKVDVALGNLHNHIGNTRLLKGAAENELILFRAGNSNSTTIGLNRGGAISLATQAFATNITLWRTVYHEIAHNWDDTSGNAHIPAFREISDWRDAATRPTSQHFASTDGDDNWWYLGDQFARAYGRNNPFDDYATTWETYFLSAYHGTTGGNKVIATKLANLDLLFDELGLRA